MPEPAPQRLALPLLLLGLSLGGPAAAQELGRGRGGIAPILAGEDGGPRYRPAPTLAAIRTGAVAEQGHEGEAVTWLQQRLTDLGFGIGRSGQFGPQTAATLQAFQRAYRVQPTGKLGPTTVDALDRARESSITLEQLMRVMPDLGETSAREYLPLLNAAMAEADISTPLRKAAFLAQLAHESLELTAFEEFASGADYEGRRDLGNTQRGDGRRYKGRGPIQLTGRSNYRDAGRALGLDLEGNPTLAATPEVGFRVAAFIWTREGLNEPADQGALRTVTRRINGGLNGYADRAAYYLRAKRALGLR